MSSLLTDLQVIGKIAGEKESENDAFRAFLQNRDSKAIDSIVHELNDSIARKLIAPNAVIAAGR
ncbi:MAG: hypothetical protein IPP72_20540 [Chitinophagaceae bacterium]|nr:hypothetical protein [Chitinophagaceae bacterium]